MNFQKLIQKFEKKQHDEFYKFYKVRSQLFVYIIQAKRKIIHGI